MPIARAEPLSPLAAAGRAGASLALTLAVSSCAVTTTEQAAPPISGAAPSAAPRSPAAAAPSVEPGLPVSTPDLDGAPPLVEGMPVPRDLNVAFTELLDRRAAAIVERDRGAFSATLDQQDDGFLIAQQGYFDNLVQLPLAAFSYAVDPSSLVRRGRSYSVVVEITMQLDGFDTLPSRTLDRFRFAEQGRGDKRRYLLSSVTDGSWEDTHAIQSQPWEARPIQVRRRGGVLAVFDDSSVAAARPLMRDLERSVADVASRVPYPWAGTVVVYALSDTSFIGSLDGLPGDDPDALDGIAFTVPAGSGDPNIVATRIALNPRILLSPGLDRQRLLRHELTHVAVGQRDDHAPVWLSEGLAEWVSVQVLPERQRQVDDEALLAARLGARPMPDDASFNDDDAALHYAVSWWVSQYLATTYGESAPWAVLDAFAAPDAAEEPTIRALLQIGVDKLAKRATALLVKTYAPEPSPPRGGGRDGGGGDRSGTRPTDRPGRA